MGWRDEAAIVLSSQVNRDISDNLEKPLKHYQEAEPINFRLIFNAILFFFFARKSACLSGNSLRPSKVASNCMILQIKTNQSERSEMGERKKRTHSARHELTRYS